MTTYRMDRPAPGPSPRLARLTRHLAARLEDFGPGGPQVVLCDQGRGLVAARFPGRDAAFVVAGLQQFGFFPAREGELIRFYLVPDCPFEALDALWGYLFSLLE